MVLRPQLATLPGLGPSDEELTDADIFEVDGVTMRTTVQCPPARPSMGPAFVRGFLPTLLESVDDSFEGAACTTGVRLRDTLPDDFDAEGPTPLREHQAAS